MPSSARDDDELRGQLGIDALEAIGHGANHAGRAAAVVSSIHDDPTGVFYETFGMAQAIFDLKTKRGIHCRKSGNHRTSPKTKSAQIRRLFGRRA
jgi:hypothetical protein